MSRVTAVMLFWRNGFLVCYEFASIVGLKGLSVPFHADAVTGKAFDNFLSLLSIVLINVSSMKILFVTVSKSMLSHPCLVVFRSEPPNHRDNLTKSS